MDDNTNICCPLSCPHQSQKLQNFLSDLERKLRVMKVLIEGDEKASSDRNEIHQNNKSELVQTLQELSRSYHFFAKEIYPLRSKSRVSTSRPSSSSSNVGDDRCRYCSDRSRVVAYHDPDMEASEDSPGSAVDYLMGTEQYCDMEFLADEAILDMSFSDKDCARKVHFFKLVEENLRQKEELLKRNEEKRSTINMLRLQLECLKSENRALQECLGHRPAGLKRSHSQIIKGLFCDKFFKVGCS